MNISIHQFHYNGNKLTKVNRHFKTVKTEADAKAFCKAYSTPKIKYGYQAPEYLEFSESLSNIIS